MKWDIFICHSSEDKEIFVDPLANLLKDLSVRVWYDRFIVMPGDSLTKKISEGLSNCRFGLIVLSNDFFKKKWTTYELSGLMGLFIEERIRILPIWLNITKEEVSLHNPALADIFAIIANKDQVEKSVFDILKVVRPQIYNNLAVNTGELKDKTIARIRKCNLDELVPGPIRHHDLPDHLLIRIQNIWYCIRDIKAGSLEEMIENFQRDLNPENEIEVWERIISAMHVALDILTSYDLVTKKTILANMLVLSLGDTDSLFENTTPGSKEEKMAYISGHAWMNAQPSVAISDVEKL